MKLTTALENYLKTSFEAKEEKKERRFYISDMGKCMRMRWLKRKGIDSEFSPHVYWILQIGNLYHDYGYKALEAQGLLLEAEDYVKTEHFIGRYDGIVKNDDKKSAFDFKSCGGWKMNKVVGGTEDDEFSISQLLTYVMLLQEDGKDVTNEAFLVYINKEPSDKCPHAFFQRAYTLTKWRRKQLKEEMDSLVDYWIKNKIPKCTCPAWMKAYNAYQPLCQAKDKEIKDYLKMIKDGKKLITTKKALYLVNGKKRKEVLRI